MFLRSLSRKHVPYRRRFTGDSSTYDLFVIGGGSGGISAAKAAAALGKKVALCDFVKPSPQNTTWGLGGTCVNVGCIPKKLQHQAGALKEGFRDAVSFGWQVDPDLVSLDWNKMTSSIQQHIKSLNFGYKGQLITNDITFLPQLATIIDPHTISTKNKKGVETTHTAHNIVISVGGRPTLPDIPGISHAITSDDFFSLPHPPGKTLVVGASYIALECAGILNQLGFDTTVLVRSIILRGFDQQMANFVKDYMEQEGVRFQASAVPNSIEKQADGKLKVNYTQGDSVVEELYDTVLFAVGRTADTQSLFLPGLGIQTTSTGKIITNEAEQTQVPSIYAIGDCVAGAPELTPVAIKSGVLLAKRLFSDSKELINYKNVATTVFTPLEYSTIGYSEEEAVKKFGADNIDVYHSYFQPLEATVPHRLENKCYIKLITNKLENEKVIGFHLLAPHSSEIAQGVAVAFTCGATKEHFDNTIGIHPTIAEEMNLLKVTKRSGKDAHKTGC